MINLSSDGFVMYNKVVAKKLGVYPAIMLGELTSESNHWEKQGMLMDGWFFSTIQNIEENTMLSRKQQESAIDKLLESGVIEKAIMGVPAKRYFRINESALSMLFWTNKFVQKEQTNVSESDKLDCPKVTTNNNNTIIINENKKERGDCEAIPPSPSSLDQPVTLRKRFVRPTEEEVEKYVEEKRYSVDPQKFVAFYDSKGWKVGNTPMKDWKKAVVTWELRDKPRVVKEKEITEEERQRRYEEWLKGDL